jgi:hypothetical protein
MQIAFRTKSSKTMKINTLLKNLEELNERNRLYFLVNHILLVHSEDDVYFFFDFYLKHENDSMEL